MAAVTSTIMAVGGLALSAGQMVKANKDKQAAQSAAALAASTIKNTTQQNSFKALQAPDVSSLSEQSNLQSQAQTVQALQDMGPAGAAQIANVGQGTRMANLEAAQAQGQVNFQRDAMQAQAQQEINRDQYLTETNLEMARLEGAQNMEQQADINRNAAITGMFGAAGGIATGLGDAIPLYREKKGTQQSGKAQQSSTVPASGFINDWGQATRPVPPGTVYKK